LCVLYQHTQNKGGQGQVIFANFATDCQEGMEGEKRTKWGGQKEEWLPFAAGHPKIVHF